MEDVKTAYYSAPIVKNGTSRTDLVGTVFVRNQEYVVRLSKTHKITHCRPSIFSGVFSKWKPYEAPCSEVGGVTIIEDFDVSDFLNSRRMRPPKDELAVEVLGIKEKQDRGCKIASVKMVEHRAKEDEGYWRKTHMHTALSRVRFVAYAPLAEGKQGNRERKRVERSIFKSTKIFESYWGWIVHTMVPDDHYKKLNEEVVEKPKDRAWLTCALFSMEKSFPGNFNSEFAAPCPELPYSES